MLDFHRRARNATRGDPVSPGGRPPGQGGPFRLIAALAVLIALGLGIRRLVPHEPLDTAAPREAVRGHDRSRELPGLDRSRLDAVEDDTLKLELDVMLPVLALLHRTPKAEIEGASIGRATYLQLDQQSDAYRGDVVTIRGTARRAHRLSAPDNEQQIQKYYELYVQPDDRRDFLMLVYTAELPHGFPKGMAIEAPLTVTGVYFKRTAYAGAESLWTAPTLLAKTVDWSRPRDMTAAPPSGERATRYASPLFRAVAVGCAMLVAGTVVLLLWRRTRRGRPALPERIGPIDIEPRESEESWPGDTS